MLTAALVIGAMLAVAAVWFVARPFLGRETDALPAEPPPERLALEEERDRALAALKDLEFDHRTGKISDDDYRSLVGDLRRDAAEALKALDGGTPRADDRVSRLTTHLRARPSSRSRCPSRRPFPPIRPVR